MNNRGMAKAVVIAVLGLFVAGAISQSHIYPALDTNNPFTGSNSFNGPTTFASSTNKVLKVLDATAYSGSDIGAQITNAYASADCPATGCHIKIPTGIYGALGTWTTPIAFSTAAKPAYLECDQGGQGIINAPTGTTQLIYSGTGAAITFNSGGGTGAGMSGCTLTGPSSASATQGLLVGGNFGTTEGIFSNNDISDFGVGIQFGSNTYVTSFQYNVVHDNGKQVYAPPSITGFGENITFIGGDFYNKAGAQATGIDLEASGDYHFIANSFDEAFITVAAPALQLDLVSPHFENPVAATTTDFLTMTSACTACRVSSTGGYWLEDGVSARTEFILDAAANSSVQLFGGGFTAAETVAQLVRFTGANASFYGMGLSNFQALFTADSSGALVALSCSNTDFPSACIANRPFSAPAFIGTGSGAAIGSGQAGNTDLVGFLNFSASTSASYSFAGTYSLHPECPAIEPQFDMGSGNRYWVTYTGTTSFTIHFATPVTGSVSYGCIYKI